MRGELPLLPRELETNRHVDSDGFIIRYSSIIGLRAIYITSESISLGNIKKFVNRGILTLPVP